MDVSKTFLSQTRKNPHIQKHFLNAWERDCNRSFNEDDVLRIFSKIKTHHNLLKNHHFDVVSKTDFELIEDGIEDLVKKNHIEKLKKNLLSNKYKHLADHYTEQILERLVDNNIDKHTIKHYLKKLASFRQSDELNEALNTCLSEQTSFGIESIMQTIKKYKLDVDVPYLSHEQNLLVLKINNFKASKMLGSTNWCISRTQNYFKQYTLRSKRGTSRTPAHQFFVYDFKKEPSDPMSMLGITLTDKSFIFAADKRDRSIRNHSLIKFVEELNLKHYYNADYYIDYLVHSLKGKDYEAFEFLKHYVSRLDVSEMTPESVIRLSRLMDEHFQSKSLNRASKRFLGKIVVEYNKHHALTPEIKELVAFKIPNIQPKISNKK